MRLNVSNYRCILDKSGLKNEEVCKRVGLSEKTLSWILDNQYIECSTLEHIADAIGCTPREIALPDEVRCTENIIEWTRDKEQATLTLSQQRTITRVRRLAEKHPEECQIVAENEDGSICAHVPARWIVIRPFRHMSEEERERKRELMNNYHQNHDHNTGN